MLEINLSETCEYDLAELIQKITEAGQVILKFKTSVGISGSHLPIAEDFLEAWYISERISKSCKLNDLKQTFEQYRLVISFTAVPDSVEPFAREILYFCQIRSDDISDYDTDEYWGNIYEFIENSSQLGTKFPELGDNYWANYIGGFYDLDEESVHNMCGKHPEYLFHFWRSCYSNNLGFNFYTSPDSVIVSLENNPLEVIVKFFSINQEKLIFSKATLVQFGEYHICSSEVWGYVKIPRQALLLSLQCAGLVLGYDLNLTYIDYAVYEIALIEGADIAILRCENSFIVIPGSERVSQIDLDNILRYAVGLSDTLISHFNVPVSVSCPWNELNDEQFEQLCYDVIIACGKYDADTIQKMGKSRSRDGGRDIQVYSKSLPGTLQKKWIIQCKKIAPDTSLAASKLKISDIIDQYGADGYCIMTSGLVDATLYDRLDGITKTRNKEYKVWSVLEIERFLVSQPVIKARYFSKSPEQSPNP